VGARLKTLFMRMQSKNPIVFAETYKVPYYSLADTIEELVKMRTFWPSIKVLWRISIQE